MPMNRAGKIIFLFAVCLVVVALFIRCKSKKEGANPTASVHFGKTETRSSMVSGSSSSSSDNSTFNSSRVLLVCPEDHPLMKRVAPLLAEQLKGCDQIDQLEVVNELPILSKGALAPDLFLRVELVELEEEGILSSSMKAEIKGFIGNTPSQSSYYERDWVSPPTVMFAWDGTLENTTKFSGIRTDRYGDVAKDIAGQFAKAFTNEIASLSVKYPRLPQLPREFYGPYEPFPDLKFLKPLQPELVCSYYGLLTHNETFWRFRVLDNPTNTLRSIIEQLKGSQWKLVNESITNTPDQIVRFERPDQAELEVFRERRGGVLMNASKETGFRFAAHYRKPFTREELDGALDKLFANNYPLESILPFQDSLGPKLRSRFYELVEKSPVTSPQACVQLADIYFERKQTNSAINMLVRAKALSTSLRDASSVQSSIESTAKKISPKQTLKLEVTPEICRELGFLELTNAAQTFKVERSFGQPIYMFGAGKRGLQLVSLTVGAPQKGTYSWQFNDAGDTGRSTTWSSFTFGPTKSWEQTFDRYGSRMKIKVSAGSSTNTLNYLVETSR